MAATCGNVRRLYSADSVSMYLPVEDVHMRALERTISIAG